MFCPNCTTTVDDGDNFCRHCGAPLSGAMLPVPATQRYPAVPWRNVAVTLAQGVAAIAMSTALEMAARSLAKKALQFPLALRDSGSVAKPVESQGQAKIIPFESYSESHTVYIRRIRIR